MDRIFPALKTGESARFLCFFCDVLFRRPFLSPFLKIPNSEKRIINDKCNQEIDQLHDRTGDFPARRQITGNQRRHRPRHGDSRRFCHHPVLIPMYVAVMVKSGAMIKGTINSGFMTSGIPKIIGSLMLKIAGPMPRRPSCFICLLLERTSMVSTRASVAPLPPTLIHI